MDKNIALLGIFSAVAVAASFFLAFYFLFIEKHDGVKSNLLGLLFVAIGFRIAKSIIYFIFIDVISAGLAMGFLGLASIGPLLFLFIRQFNLNHEHFKSYFLIHFVFPFLGIFVCFFTHLGHITLLYKIATGIFFIYLLLALYDHRMQIYRTEGLKRWNTNLLIGICIIWFAIASQHVFSEIIYYAAATGVASIAIYFIFIQALNSNNIFSKPKVKVVPKEIIRDIRSAFEVEKVYLNQSITLTNFSQKYKIPAYLVTESVKQLYDKRFPETINYFRVEHVKNKLLVMDESNPKIEGLAYEAGFNTPSTFYSAFKKETNMTPTQFQKNQNP